MIKKKKKNVYRTVCMSWKQQHLAIRNLLKE